MNNLNSFIMDGHLKDAPKEFGINGECILTVAVCRSFINKKKKTVEEMVYIPVKVPNSMSVYCKKHLIKDDLVRVMGRLTDNNGQLVVMAERIDFVNKKKKDRIITIDSESGIQYSQED